MTNRIERSHTGYTRREFFETLLRPTIRSIRYHRPRSEEDVSVKQPDFQGSSRDMTRRTFLKYTWALMANAVIAGCMPKGRGLKGRRSEGGIRCSPSQVNLGDEEEMILDFAEETAEDDITVGYPPEVVPLIVLGHVASSLATGAFQELYSAYVNSLKFVRGRFRVERNYYEDSVSELVNREAYGVVVPVNREQVNKSRINPSKIIDVTGLRGEELELLVNGGAPSSKRKAMLSRLPRVDLRFPIPVEIIGEVEGLSIGAYPYVLVETKVDGMVKKLLVPLNYFLGGNIPLQNNKSLKRRLVLITGKDAAGEIAAYLKELGGWISIRNLQVTYTNSDTLEFVKQSMVGRMPWPEVIVPEELKGLIRDPKFIEHHTLRGHFIPEELREIYRKANEIVILPGKKGFEVVIIREVIEGEGDRIVIGFFNKGFPLTHYSLSTEFPIKATGVFIDYMRRAFGGSPEVVHLVRKGDREIFVTRKAGVFSIFSLGRKMKFLDAKNLLVRIWESRGVKVLFRTANFTFKVLDILAALGYAMSISEKVYNQQGFLNKVVGAYNSNIGESNPPIEAVTVLSLDEKGYSLPQGDTYSPYALILMPDSPLEGYDVLPKAKGVLVFVPFDDPLVKDLGISGKDLALILPEIGARRAILENLSYLPVVVSGQELLEFIESQQDSKEGQMRVGGIEITCSAGENLESFLKLFQEEGV